MSEQFLNALRAAFAGEVIGRSAEHHFLAAKRPTAERGGQIRRAANAHGDINAFIEQIEKAIGKCHVQFNFRMLLAERDQQRHHAQSPVGIRHRQPQPAGRDRAMRRQHGLRFRQFLQNAYAGLVVRLPGIGQHQAARGALQQT